MIGGRRALGAVAVGWLAIALALGGCGGDDSDDGPADANGAGDATSASTSGGSPETTSAGGGDAAADDCPLALAQVREAHPEVESGPRTVLGQGVGDPACSFGDDVGVPLVTIGIYPASEFERQVSEHQGSDPVPGLADEAMYSSTQSSIVALADDRVIVVSAAGAPDPEQTCTELVEAILGSDGGA